MAVEASEMSRNSPITYVPVPRIRPEDGLGRKRDRAGHSELQRSIARFGVLTPITVRRAKDGSGDYLLIKGQGRALACRLLGMDTIPAIVVDDEYAETKKVQQFLVENVARLKMRPVDRALLISHARENGEETSTVAKRFGVSAATVRRLEAQLDGASTQEVAALRDGSVNLAMHAVIARHVDSGERADVVKIVAGSSITKRQMETLLVALDWKELTNLGPQYRSDRTRLLVWACGEVCKLQALTSDEWLRHLALNLPLNLDRDLPHGTLEVAQ